ncbi:hypothetical protein AJ80_03611 [Polytolypa hystricis UAMH7299]|uniref:Rhodopsin domain-containing protein n=1 Tax=Polytolypa hystricis (strain UAMH7299) TaxID=1447883 RepID=A0A2B7YH41_POLH7|nr:hypothetical protein AJ80_03611 [Polytolypa hystricis UAMH7299]
MEREITYYNVFHHAVVRNQLIANTVLVVVALTVVIIRFVARHLRNAKIWWDDVCIVISLLHTFGMLAMHYIYAAIGMRNHMLEIPPQNTTIIFKMLIIYQVVYYNAMVSAKFSYLFFYLRIFVSKPFRIAAQVCMGCSGAYWLGSTLQIFLTCRPFAFNWDPTIPGGSCANQNVAFSTIGAFNLLTDLMIIALPLHFVYRLQMSLATKIALYGIFCVGLFISAITIIRIRVLTTVDFLDLPFSMIHAAFWSVTEPALAVANACVPMIRPVLKKFFPGLFSTVKATYNTYDTHGSNTNPSRNNPLARSGNSSNTYNKMQDGEYPLTCMDQGVTTIDILASQKGQHGNNSSSSVDERYNNYDSQSTHSR